MLYLIASTVCFGGDSKTSISKLFDKGTHQSNDGKTYIKKSLIYGSDRWELYRNGRKTGYLERDIIFRDRYHLFIEDD